ncbi:hypothetical protein FPOAC1_003667 [Fusarium poae]|uniref:hypothetical protein n=1 Tax=Fusarium poae TaxID=36050 RepID=UPI001CE94740|nr:hypothetical protein FPOAC1_003667 [Fusarium poae]KAG8677642.1 hypothetical protein FPOAC1_003667 [Fusarium poae]
MASTASPSEVAQLTSESLLPPEERQWACHKKLAHFYDSNRCIYCRDSTVTPKDAARGYRLDSQDPFLNKGPCALLYCKDPHIGTWKLIWDINRDMDLSKYEGEGICWCSTEDKKIEFIDGFLTFHQECLVALNGRDFSAERIDRLGRAMFWTTIRHLDLSDNNSDYFANIPDVQDYPHDSISSMGQKIGLPLDRLPLEILQHIQSYCHDCLFWEMVKKLDFTTCLELGPRTKMLSVSLARVVEWTRGSNSPVLSSRKAKSGHVRITVDSQGFCEIERLSEYPRVCLKKQPYKRFIILEARHATEINCSFKDGMCWLGLRKADSISTVWDIPTPPAGPLSCMLTTRKHLCHENIENCSLMDVHRNYPLNARLETVDLGGIGGLFILLTHGKICIKTYSKPAPLRYPRDSWGTMAHMPLASNDRILWVQVRKYSDHDLVLGVKTELSGIIHLGQKGTEPSKTIAFSESPRAIFHHRDRNIPGGVLAIDPKSHPSPDHEVFNLANVGPPIPNIGHSTSMWSWAPLQDIAIIHVFTTAGKGHFVGMHITYNNGGQRFVGDPNQSAPHQTRRVPPVEVRVKNPTRLYVETKIRQERSQRVVFSVGERRVFERDPTWKKYELTGKRNFWEFHFWYIPKTLPPYQDEVQVLTPGLAPGSWRG